MNESEHRSERVAGEGGTGRPSARRRRFSPRGVLRVAGFAVVVAVGLGAVSLKTAAARTRDSLDEVGGELFANAGALGNSTRLSINGAMVYGAARNVELDVDTALDRIEARCGETTATADDPDWLETTLTATPSVTKRADGPSGLARIAVDRRDGQGGGSVVCVQRTREADGGGSWLAGITAFARSGDLGELGKARYVVARPSGPHRTLVVGIWTEGSFNVREMVRASGDAPGSDIDGIPRPTGSRRILSAEVVGRHYGVHSYECGESIAQVLGQYDETMVRRGWHRVATGLSTASNAPPIASYIDQTSRSFVQGGVSVIFDATVQDDGRTRLDIVQMGGVRQGPAFAETR